MAKLSKSEREELVYDLVYAIIQAKTVKDATLFLQDLLTKTEVEVLSKRLRIAKLLLKGMTHEEVTMQLHAGYGTVAKIAAWLSERGEGFRRIIQKLPQDKDTNTIDELSEWSSLKKRYPIYFWPEILLEEIIKGASKRQKARIRNVLGRLEEKSELHKKIENLLLQNLHPT